MENKNNKNSLTKKEVYLDFNQIHDFRQSVKIISYSKEYILELLDKMNAQEWVERNCKFDDLSNIYKSIRRLYTAVDYMNAFVDNNILVHYSDEKSLNCEYINSKKEVFLRVDELHDFYQYVKIMSSSEKNVISILERMNAKEWVEKNTQDRDDYNIFYLLDNLYRAIDYMKKLIDDNIEIKYLDEGDRDYERLSFTKDLIYINKR